jgi:hypothetical protein
MLPEIDEMRLNSKITILIRTSPRLALPGAMGPDGPKVSLELNNDALPHMAQRSEGFLQNPNII